eukprot:599453-Hanusia_phi.AAC.1
MSSFLPPSHVSLCDPLLMPPPFLDDSPLLLSQKDIYEYLAPGDSIDVSEEIMDMAMPLWDQLITWPDHNLSFPPPSSSFADTSAGRSESESHTSETRKS